MYDMQEVVCVLRDSKPQRESFVDVTNQRGSDS